MSLRPALFLDRDGVINVHRGYVCSSKEFEFVEGIFEVCREAQKLGFLIVVVTNQSAIGRGFLTEKAFLELTDWMCQVFRSEGVVIDRVYFSPHHPEHGIAKYKTDSPFRKPAPGMILQARDELGVDLSRSVLIGDSESDIKAGTAAGVACNLLFSDATTEATDTTKASAIIRELRSALGFIQELHRTIDPTGTHGPT